MAEVDLNDRVDAQSRCPKCEYDLRAHVDDAGAVCPECGTHSTLDEILPPRHPGAFRVSARFIAIGVLPSVMFIGIDVIVGRVLRGAGADDEAMFGLFIVSAAAAIIASLIIAMHVERRDRPSLTRSADVSVILALWVTIVGLNALLSIAPGMCCISFLLSPF